VPVQSRDLFGLKELPIRTVFSLHPDVKEAIRWRKYLESRRRSGGMQAACRPLQHARCARWTDCA